MHRWWLPPDVCRTVTTRWRYTTGVCSQFVSTIGPTSGAVGSQCFWISGCWPIAIVGSDNLQWPHRSFTLFSCLRRIYCFVTGITQSISSEVLEDKQRTGVVCMYVCRYMQVPLSTARHILNVEIARPKGSVPHSWISGFFSRTAALMSYHPLCASAGVSCHMQKILGRTGRECVGRSP